MRKLEKATPETPTAKVAVTTRRVCMSGEKKTSEAQAI